MAFDPYSPCPGGRNEKIKHCCPDLVKELEQIQTMLQGGQYAGCLGYIRELEKNHPNCACLISQKCELLQALGQFDELIPTAEAFVHQEPTNTKAKSILSEALLAQGRSSESNRLLIESIEQEEPGHVPSYILESMFKLSVFYMETGKTHISIPILKFLTAFLPDNTDIAQLLQRAYSQSDIPLLLRDMMLPVDCPMSFPGYEKYRDMEQFAGYGHWQKATKAVEELLPQAEGWPSLYLAAAILYFWQEDEFHACDMLQKYMALPGISNDDLADAIRLYQYGTSGTIVDDPLDIVRSSYTILNENDAVEKLLSSPMLNSFDVSRFKEGEMGPPPRNGFTLLDRPLPLPSSEPNLQNTPVGICLVLLFGKRTDREARIEFVGIPSKQLETAVSSLRDILGDSLGEEEKTELVSHASWTLYKMEYPAVIRNMSSIKPEIIEQMRKQWLTDIFVPAWCNHPMQILNGKTPLEVSQIPEEKARLTAACALFDDFIQDSVVYQLVMGALRANLNLPEPEPIKLIQEEDGSISFDEFDRIPVWRWDRIDVTNIQVRQLDQLLSSAMVLKQFRTAKHISDAILARSDESSSYEDRMTAYDFTINNESGTGNYTKAIELSQKASQDAMAHGQSDGHWNVQEMLVYLLHGPQNLATSMIDHISREHRQEKEVMQEFFSILMELGIIRQDGTPTGYMPAGRAQAQAAAPPEQPASPGLWTPDGGNTGNGNASSGGSKLWVPD